MYLMALTEAQISTLMWQSGEQDSNEHQREKWRMERQTDQTWQKDKDYGEQYPYYHEDDLSCPQRTDHCQVWHIQDSRSVQRESLVQPALGNTLNRLYQPCRVQTHVQDHMDHVLCAWWLVMPRFGPEPKFEPEPLWTWPKSGSKLKIVWTGPEIRFCNVILPELLPNMAEVWSKITELDWTQVWGFLPRTGPNCYGSVEYL